MQAVCGPSGSSGSSAAKTTMRVVSVWSGAEQTTRTSHTVPTPLPVASTLTARPTAEAPTAATHTVTDGPEIRSAVHVVESGSTVNDAVMMPVPVASASPITPTAGSDSVGSQGST